MGSSSCPIHVRRTLSVDKRGSGKGKVTSQPAGINCGTTCVRSFAFGTKVTLRAHAKKGSIFKGWSAACSGKTACHVTMTVARHVTATFKHKKHHKKP